jgi:histidine triad (HIT) family protein
MSDERGGCVFCRIMNGEAKCNKVYEDETSIAFLDAKPITRGHTLVAPKRHVEGLLNLKPEERAMFIESIAATCRLVEKLSPHYNIGCNRGELAGQIIFHLHVHIIPRYDDTRNIFNRRLLITPEDERRIMKEMGATNTSSDADGD